VVRLVGADAAVQDAAQDDIAQGEEQGAEEQGRAQQGDGAGAQRLSGARAREYPLCRRERRVYPGPRLGGELLEFEF
jgi:hypothetical protein